MSDATPYILIDTVWSIVNTTEYYMFRREVYHHQVRYVSQYFGIMYRVHIQGRNYNPNITIDKSEINLYELVIISYQSSLTINLSSLGQ